MGTSRFTTSGPWKIEWSATGDGNFIIEIYTSDGTRSDIPVNQIGPGGGSSNQPNAGEYYLDVKANGSWNISIVPVE